MFNSKTHFEQVPLEIVNKIVEEQMLTHAANEPNQEIDKEALSEVPREVEERSVGLPGAIARMKFSNQS